MADQAAPGGEDALGRDHAVDVLGRGLAADQDDPLAPPGGLLGPVGVEDGRADRRARRGGQAGGDHLEAGLLELGVQHLVEVLGA